MKLTQFETQTDKGLTVKGEYEGNETAGRVIIFSHGFGVTRDSHGMFTEIGDELKNEYLVVKFDYTIVNKEENWTKVFPYSKQVEMLKAVYKYIYNEFKPLEINIIAHSMGCLITGLAQLSNINKILLLASPPTAPYQRMKDYFAKRPETVIDESATSTIKRSDGSITYVESDFWHEMRDVNPPKMYKHLASKAEVFFVRALSDQVITEQDYENIRSIKEIDYNEIDGNHDFEGEAREKLIKLIKDMFNGN